MDEQNVEIPESMVDFMDTLEYKVQNLRLESKTLQQVKDNSRKMTIKQKDNEFTTLQERKFTVRRLREPIIILSEFEIKEMKRDSLRVKTVAAPPIDKTLLFVQVQSNAKSCQSLVLHRQQNKTKNKSKSTRSTSSSRLSIQSSNSNKRKN